MHTVNGYMRLKRFSLFRDDVVIPYFLRRIVLPVVRRNLVRWYFLMGCYLVFDNYGYYPE